MPSSQTYLIPNEILFSEYTTRSMLVKLEVLLPAANLKFLELHMLFSCINH